MCHIKVLQECYGSVGLIRELRFNKWERWTIFVHTMLQFFLLCSCAFIQKFENEPYFLERGMKLHILHR